MRITRDARKEEYQKVKDFFISLGDDFHPTIPARGNDLETDLRKAFEDGRIAVVERNGELVGACAYWRDDEVADISYTGISKENRNSAIFYRLAEQVAGSDILASVKKVRAKTWSTNTNVKRIFEKVGFRKLDEIRGDLSEDRITEVYEIESESFRNFFVR